MPMGETYNDARLGEKARAVFYKAMSKAEEMLDGTQPFNSEKMDSLSQIADAAATCIETDPDEAFGG